MGLFTVEDREKINSIAKKSQRKAAPKSSKKSITSIASEINESSEAVRAYFKDSDAILITDKYQLEEYVDAAIQSGFCGVDTETTGLDRSKDYIVGMSLYYPGGVECYIPFKHRIPVFDDFYKDQMDYDDARVQLQRFVDEKTKLIFANANFDLYMLWKDLDVDLCPAFYYDVILAWRCIKEDEPHNGLKQLYAKYYLKGEGDPKKFSDFFSPELFPYSQPEVAKLYAANDAKITYELFTWQLPFILKSHEACKSRKLENIADLIWGVEFPLVSVIQYIERAGMYIDGDTAKVLQSKYKDLYDSEMESLQSLVDDVLHDNARFRETKSKAPFTSGRDFNPRSTKHVQYLVYDLLGMENVDGKKGTSVGVLKEFNTPVTNKILAVRSLSTNISTFVNKLPDAVSSDGKIHADFKQCGAATGRMSSSDPNLQNIPSKLSDIRHMFRADPLRVENMRIGSDSDDIEANNVLHVKVWDKLESASGLGWVRASELSKGDEVCGFDGDSRSTILVQDVLVEHPDVYIRFDATAGGE